MEPLRSVESFIGQIEEALQDPKPSIDRMAKLIESNQELLQRCQNPAQGVKLGKLAYRISRLKGDPRIEAIAKTLKDYALDIRFPSEVMTLLAEQTKDGRDLRQTSKEVRRAAILAHRGPLKALQIDTADKAIEFAKEYGPYLTYLNIEWISFTENQIIELLSLVPNLKSFATDQNVNSEIVVAIASLKNFEKLDLRMNDNLDVHALVNSLNSPHLKNLRTLALGKIGRTRAQLLAHFPVLQKIQSLELVGDREAISIANSPFLNALQMLKVTGIGFDGVQAIANSKTFKQLKVLNLSEGEVGDRGAEQIAQSPLLKTVQNLYLAKNKIGDEGAKALANSPLVENLRILDLNDNYLGDSGVKEIAHSKAFKNLEWLELKNNRFGKKGAKELARFFLKGEVVWSSPHWPFYQRHKLSKLTEEELAQLESVIATLASQENDKAQWESFWDPEWGRKHLFDSRRHYEKAFAILEGREEVHYRRLPLPELLHRMVDQTVKGRADEEKERQRIQGSLSFWIKTADQAIAFAKMFSSELVDLDLSEINFTGQQISELMKWVPNVKTMAVKFWENGDECMAALAASPNVKELQALDFTISRIGPKGFEALGKSPHLKKLQELIFSKLSVESASLLSSASFNQLKKLEILEIDDQATGTLVKCPFLKQLEVLKLGRVFGSQFGNNGAKAIAQSQVLTQLKELILYQTGVGDEGAKAIAHSQNLPNLQGLHLGWTQVRGKGVAEIASSKTLTNLQSLLLYGNSLSAVTVERLADAPGLKNLKYLSLSSNYFGDLGAAAIARSPYLTGLTSLDLSNNKITDIGLAQIAQSQTLKNLQELDFSSNKIARVETLLTATFVENLQKLALRDSKLGNPEAQLLARSQKFKKLKVLDLERNDIDNVGKTELILSRALANVEFHMGEEFRDRRMRELQQRLAHLSDAEREKLFYTIGQLAREDKHPWRDNPKPGEEAKWGRAHLLDDDRIFETAMKKVESGPGR